METEVMKILSINTGSSSIKCSLYDMPEEQLLMKGEIERIGQNPAVINFEIGGKNISLKHDIADYHSGVEFFLNVLISKETKVLESLDEIKAIGHRVVHGGDKFSEAVLVDDKVLSLIKKFSEFAPLHGFANIAAIESCRKLLPNCRNIALFDTSLYHNLPPKAYLYGLPIELCEKHGIRKYGFHGINHGFVAKEAARIIGKHLQKLRMITCHLGSGCSITAFKNGFAIDTSMGFTPLEGVLMGTRPGDVDSGAIIFMLRHLALNTKQLEDLLNKESGLKGLCGKSDMRDVCSLADSGDRNAKNAVDTFVYKVQKYIGSYNASLGGLDAIVFTAGIGEHSPDLRKKILDAFDYLKIKIDEEKNLKNAEIFSSSESSVQTLVIPANEELAIARETLNLVR